jgi:uncharacterized protein (TIGR02996 family)
MRSEDSAFIDAIYAAADDIGRRGVYADWLEEHGDPRGAYLRAEVELCRLAADDPRYAEERARLFELYPEIDWAWLAAVGIRCDVILDDVAEPWLVRVRGTVSQTLGIEFAEAAYYVRRVPIQLKNYLLRPAAETIKDRIETGQPNLSPGAPLSGPRIARVRIEPTSHAPRGITPR